MPWYSVAQEAKGLKVTNILGATIVNTTKSHAVDVLCIQDKTNHFSNTYIQLVKGLLVVHEKHLRAPVFQMGPEDHL
jgi:hypothetical protein